MAGFEKVMLKDQSQPVLLAVLAHPDDETFGTGGTLALYSRRGVQVYLVCATRKCPDSWKNKTAQDVLDETGNAEEYRRIREMTSAEYIKYLNERNLSRPQ